VTVNSLDLGSNIIEFVNRPVVCPIYYHLLNEPKGDLPIFTVEDSNQGLILNTELRDANKNVIAKINRNTIEKLDNNKYEVDGIIGVGNDFKVIRKGDNVVIFNLKADNESVKITGLFSFYGSEIEITADRVHIKSINCSFWGNRITYSGNRGITLSQYGFAL